MGDQNGNVEAGTRCDHDAPTGIHWCARRTGHVGMHATDETLAPGTLLWNDRDLYTLSSLSALIEERENSTRALEDVEMRASSWWEVAKRFRRWLTRERTDRDTERARADAAETKLDKVRKVLADSTAWVEWSDAINELDRIRAVVGPVRDREQPCDCQPFDFCPKCCTPESQQEARIRQLAYCEASVQASADPEDGEQCRELREHGSVYCRAHGGKPIWDTAADYRISEDHEEPAHADDCAGCDSPGAVPCAADEVRGRFAYRNGEVIKVLSEEPAGETKPEHVLSIQDVPDEHGPRGVCSCGLWVDSDQEGSVPAIADRWGKHWLHATSLSASTSRDTPEADRG